MAENLREVIARMKGNQQNSPTSKPASVPAPKPAKVVPKEIKEAEDDYLDEEENLELEEEKPVEVEEKQDADVPVDQRIAMEIEMLQNNGRFRVELLHQLQEMNKALVVIAGVLVDLSGKNGQE